MNPLIRIENLSAGYLKGNQTRSIIQQMNASVYKGELIGIIGQNGIGKSTLLRTITRLQKSTGGNIFINGKSFSQYGRNEFARLVSFVSTDTLKLQHCTVRDLVMFGRYPFTNWLGKFTREDVNAVSEAIEMVGLEALANRFINEISDGERQRVMIARALAQNTDIIILDEPTAFLDMPNKFEVIHLLSDLARKKQKTILFSSHDLTIAMKVADRLWLILPDEFIDGAPEDLVLQHSISKIFHTTRLKFDSRKGEFNIRRKFVGICNVTGKGNALLWTKKAMERLGFDTDVDTQVIGNNPFLRSNEIIKASGDAPQKAHPVNIIIHESKDGIEWDLRSDDKPCIFKSLYDLCSFIKTYPV